MSDKTIKSEQEKLLDEISAILKQGGKTYDMIPKIEKAMIKSSGSSLSERTSEAHGEVSPLNALVRVLRSSRDAMLEVNVSHPHLSFVKQINEIEKILAKIK